MRLATLVCCLTLIVPAGLAAQTAGWIGTLDAGYLQGLGDAFSGQGAVAAHVGGYRAVGPVASLGLERARVFGRAGLGVQGRWDGVLSEGFANVISVGVALILD